MAACEPSQKEEVAFIRYRVLSWKTWSVVNVLQNSHRGQQVQVNSSLTQAGTRTLHSEHCWPRGTSTFLVLPVTQPGSSEMYSDRNRKRDKDRQARRSSFWGMQRQTSWLQSCFTPGHEGPHLSAPCEILTWQSLSRRTAEYKSE